MKRLRVSREADSDLVDIQSYGLQAYGVAATKAYYLGLLKTFDFLCEQPFVGQMDEDTVAALRRWRHRRHKVFYQVSGDELLIVRVLHQQAHVQSLLG